MFRVRQLTIFSVNRQQQLYEKILKRKVNKTEAQQNKRLKNKAKMILYN